MDKYHHFYPPTSAEWQVHGSYADREAHVNQPVDYEWVHSLGEIVSVLAAARLRIEFLHEHRCSVDRIMACLEQDAQGWWRLKGPADLPLMFSLRAVK